ncbi:Histone H2B [Spironucleus salmonicida]|uniref:Histone H2B n=1 Tax=Spironucleus salmonicida TaxID=348837 RepID=V6M088_9EUKA|nr:Histone H2B [Spironucleus salmonicida]|eukprot:EST49451.1 Histone H2B [Spironucleus salmonicida]
MDRSEISQADNSHLNENLSDTSHTRSTASAVVISRRARRARPTFQNYIYKIFRSLASDLRISKQAMDALNSFTFDMFEKITSTSFQMIKIKQRSTLGAAQVEAACKLILGDELYKEVQDKYKKAMLKYEKSISAEIQDKAEPSQNDPKVAAPKDEVAPAPAPIPKGKAKK